MNRVDFPIDDYAYLYVSPSKGRVGVYLFTFMESRLLSKDMPEDYYQEGGRYDYLAAMECEPRLPVLFQPVDVVAEYARDLFLDTGAEIGKYGV